MTKHKDIKQTDFPGQHESEEVQFIFRQHPLVMRKSLIIGLLVILLGVLPLDFPVVYTIPGLAGKLIMIALIVPVFVILAWAYRWMGWYYSVYVVTTERIMVIKQKGLFDRQVEEWQLDNITNLNYHIGGFQAVLFGYGDITAKTYIGDLEMPKIHHPAEIHEQLLAVVRAAGGGRGSTQPVKMQ